MERGDGGGMASLGSGGGGGVVGSAAMLGLDMHLAPQQMHPVALQQQADHQHQVGAAGGFQLQQPVPVRHNQQQQSFSPYSTSSSRVMTAASSHDEEMAGNGCSVKGGAVLQMGAAGCPWTRMKWTDAMVRLLIRVVYSVGDDGEGLTTGGGAGSKAAAGPHGKAGSSAAHGHGHAAAQQQKKGKWKSVSRAMMENGFLVSPQQCEDKFNDLNKRYKRVVDLLGRGRACRVVENHALLDTIDELTPKAKDEARKLLSSKHLFFREMCAYHNSGVAHAAAPHLPAHAADDAAACLHHPPPVPMAASSAARLGHGAPSPPGTKDSSADVANGDDDSDDGVSNNEDDDEYDYDEDEDGHMYPNRRLHHNHDGRGKRGRGADDSTAGEDFEDDDAGGKRARTAASGEQSPLVQQLQSELASSAAADPRAARSWVRLRMVQVEEQQLTLELRAHKLERQRLKWERFRANKERDMERAHLRNDRLRLDGQRMLLMLRSRDLELEMAEANSSSVDHHHAQGPVATHHLGSSPSTAGHPNQ